MAVEDLAAVYRRPNGIFVVGFQRADDGLTFGGPFFRRLPPEAPAEEIGSSVAEALEQNAHGVAIADEDVYDAAWQPLLDLAGVSTSSQFHDALTAVKVRRSGARVAIIALANLGSAGGFKDVGSPEELQNPTTTTLGERVLAKLQ
jgi:hypothetical protein